MQGRISKSLYTRKQRKEFLRTWTAIGRAYVSASHGPDLFQLLDISSSSLIAHNDDCDDCGLAHLSPVGFTLCTSNLTALISALKPGATSTSLFSSSGLHKKRQAGSSQGSGLGSNMLDGFSFPTPPTRNALFGFKPASDDAPTNNTSSASSAGRVSKSS
jgi:hypothetical protein